MNRESNRLVYAEGISLANALRLSTEYKNIIFLTDDDKASSESNLDTYYSDSIGSYEPYSTQPLGINIVRNGVKYVPIAGIHPTLNSFMIDGKRYELKIQKNTGLLCVVPYEIETRIIYIGKFYSDIVNTLHDMDIEEYLAQYEANSNNIDVVNVYTNGDEYVKIYFPIINQTYSYLIVYTGINALAAAKIGHLDLLNMKITDRTSNIVIYSTDDHGNVILNESAVQQLIQNFPAQNSLFYNEDGEDIYAIIPYNNINNIEITNTLGQGPGENDSENDNTMTNTDLPDSFKIEKTHEGNVTINSVLYNVYKLEAEDISGVSVRVNDNI